MKLQSGEALKLYRLRAGLSQWQLSEKTGLQVSTISRWEAGRNDPRVTDFEACLNACGYDLEIIPYKK